MIVVGVLLSFVYPRVQRRPDPLGNGVNANTVIGGFVYGTANRLLIPLGLHHILNSVRGSSSATTNGVARRHQPLPRTATRPPAPS